MVRDQSLAEMAVDILETLGKPLTAKQISKHLNYNYTSEEITWALRHWVIKGIVGKQKKKHSEKMNEYFLLQ